jgi:hypothetical protein
MNLMMIDNQSGDRLGKSDGTDRDNEIDNHSGGRLGKSDGTDRDNEIDNHSGDPLIQSDGDGTKCPNIHIALDIIFE